MPYGVQKRSVHVKSANENREPPINWRRGLIRVWIVVSAAWIMGWTIYLIIFGLQGGLRQFGQMLAVPVVLFGPPVALFLLGYGARWAMHGFRGEPGPR